MKKTSSAVQKYIPGLATVILFAPASIHGILISFGVFIICMDLISINESSVHLNKVERVFCALISGGIALFSIPLFVERWRISSKVSVISSTLHLSAEIFLLLLGLILSVFSTLFLYSSLSLFKRIKELPALFHSSVDTEIPLETSCTTLTKKEISMILLCSVGFITICSRSSFLYPFNNWDDANCFYTVGKAMFNGLVPYRDLYEQKGPLLYFLHGLSWLVSHDTFAGVYILEVIASFIYLLYSYRITLLLLSKRRIGLIPIIALVSYVSFAFDHGDSAEELCLPLLSFSLWIILKAAVYGDSSRRNFLFLGIAAACVFWTKFSLIGLYLAWYIVFSIDSIRHRKGKKLFLQTIMIIYGVILSTIPWVLYFGLNNALGDWLKVYLYNNLFVYSDLSVTVGFIARGIPLLGNLLTGVHSFLTTNPIVFTLCISLFILCRKNRIALLVSFMALGTFCLIYIGGRDYRYYSLVMDVFIAPSIVLLISYTKKDLIFNRIKFHPLSIATACLLAAYLFTPNGYFMFVEKDSLVQYKFRNIIQADSQEATILNYDFLDGGFYTTCNVLPNCKAFCGLNIGLEELKECQDYYVDNGLCDYIITRSAASSNEKMVFERYECIEECLSDYSYELRKYRLYRLKDEYK